MIPNEVLQKPGALTGQEFDLIRQHPLFGKQILEKIDGLHEYIPIVELHHENYDGSGYPYGLRGNEVPLAARIVRVADAYDAMRSDRPYREGITHEGAIDCLTHFAGIHFDPEVVVALRSMRAVDW